VPSGYLALAAFIGRQHGSVTSSTTLGPFNLSSNVTGDDNVFVLIPTPTQGPGGSFHGHGDGDGHGHGDDDDGDQSGSFDDWVAGVFDEAHSDVVRGIVLPSCWPGHH
jgi:hypothetical protein